MFNLKNLLLFTFVILASSFYAQEICDNGIDDDNDNLIDINDDDCQCMGSVPYELTFGSICRNNLRLIVDDTDATGVQWYHDGIAIPGEIFDRINLTESISNVEGTYMAMITYSDGCFLSEPYEVVINSYEVYLGEETICDGESIQFGNFSISTQGFFQNDASASDGCDSTTSLTVIVEQPQFYFDTVSVCNGEAYDWDGMILTAEGEYETSYPGVGCDSVVTLTLSYFDNAEADISATICEGDDYVLYDLVANTTGQHQALFSNPNGCDTIFNVDLTVLESSESYIQESICDGDTLTFLDIVESTSGLYNTTLTNAVGCDSIITLELTVLEEKTNIIQANICDGQTYTLLDISETESGTYETVIPASNGCDSLIIVELTVGQEVDLQLEASICEGNSYSIYDINENQTGVYMTTIASGGFCDTIVTLTLTVNQKTTYTSQETICDGDTFIMDGINASTTGIYESTITNSAGCDSLIIIDLNVIPQSNTVVAESFCEGDTYNWHDISTDVAGTYQTTLISESGCDSIVTLELEMELIPRATIYKTICEGEEFIYRDLIVNESGIYETSVSNTNSCDSIITLELTVNLPADGISLGDDIEVNLGQTIDIIPEFIGEGVTDLIWIDENGETVSEEYELLNIQPTEDTHFEIYAIDANGCDAYDIIFIDVEINIDIYIPNVFSPSMNNEESKFTVGFNEAVEGVHSVQIYDRWGNLVFNLDNGDSFGYEGWDGTRNGKFVENGVYTYVFIFDILDGSQVQRAGSITKL
ncbi:gliding motility-associated C-terminal domain-containing protein [Saprospiraceae bacterium]|nr:gliding motility-associated C-terminal domain-containing protein [Saprospiraceae bacterium]